MRRLFAFFEVSEVKMTRLRQVDALHVDLPLAHT